MSKETQDILAHLAELLGAGVVGGLIVAFITHRLTIGRDRSSGRASRKREFLSFMRAWKVEVSRTYLEPGGFAYDPSSINDSVSHFAALAESVRGDLIGQSLKRFSELVSTITGFRGGRLHIKGGHEAIQKAFDEIIEVVEKA